MVTTACLGRPPSVYSRRSTPEANRKKRIDIVTRDELDNKRYSSSKKSGDKYRVIGPDSICERIRANDAADPDQMDSEAFLVWFSPHGAKEKVENTSQYERYDVRQPPSIAQDLVAIDADDDSE